jgi:hypothetical protein
MFLSNLELFGLEVCKDSACGMRNFSTLKYEVLIYILLISVCKFECVSDLFHLLWKLYQKLEISLTHSN